MYGSFNVQVDLSHLMWEYFETHIEGTLSKKVSSQWSASAIAG